MKRFLWLLAGWLVVGFSSGYGWESPAGFQNQSELPCPPECDEGWFLRYPGLPAELLFTIEKVDSQKGWIQVDSYSSEVARPFYQNQIARAIQTHQPAFFRIPSVPMKGMPYLQVLYIFKSTQGIHVDETQPDFMLVSGEEWESRTETTETTVTNPAYGGSYLNPGYGVTNGLAPAGVVVSPHGRRVYYPGDTVVLGGRKGPQVIPSQRGDEGYSGQDSQTIKTVRHFKDFYKVQTEYCFSDGLFVSKKVKTKTFERSLQQ